VIDPHDTPLRRRDFLKIIGATGAVAGCSSRAATQKVIPFLIPPEEIVPGMPLFYRTVCRECPAGCGVTARTREGRAVKLEGNPEDPIGAGALCARGQASIQALYHPDRFRGALRRGAAGTLEPVAWEEAQEQLASAVHTARARGPRRIRLLTRPEAGSAGEVQRAVLRALGAGEEDRVVLEPLDPAPVREACRLLLGEAELPAYDLAQARTVVAFGADFLETWQSPVELARGLAAGRGATGPARSRFTWVGPRLSLTGVSADLWLRCRAGGEVAVALAVLRQVVLALGRDLPPEAAGLRPALEALSPEALAARADVPLARLDALAAELVTRRPSALLGPGPASQGADAVQLAGLLLLTNLVLGNLGRTVQLGRDPVQDPPAAARQVDQLLADMTRGEVDVLLLHHVDPLAVLPIALQPAAALAMVPLVVSFGLRPDASTSAVHLVLPDHHPLESIGDLTPRRGVVALAQPVMKPLHDTRSAPQVLLELGRREAGASGAGLASLPQGDYPELVRERDLHREGQGAEDAVARSHAAFQRGGRYQPPADPGPRRASMAEAARWIALPPPAAVQAGELDLVVFPTALRGDGRGADLPWLREIPDALSSVSWTPWAEVAPATAARLGLKSGDQLAIETRAGRAVLPAYVYPGLREDAVAVPLGAEALALLPGALDAAGMRPLAGARARLARTGAPTRLPVLEGSPYQHGREIVPLAHGDGTPLPRPDLSKRMVPGTTHPGHRWAMAVDLDRCTGCEACVVACFAENNVPVMGPEAAERGRYMGWLRIERYLGDEPGGELDVRLMPLM
jgi:anaerobic selenocysteine-containing dehydrogenase